MKIAPNLRLVVNAIRREDAKAELRALLAVAREAQKFGDYWDHVGPKWRPLQRALARLERVSGGGK